MLCRHSKEKGNRLVLLRLQPLEEIGLGGGDVGVGATEEDQVAEGLALLHSAMQHGESRMLPAASTAMPWRILLSRKTRRTAHAFGEKAMLRHAAEHASAPPVR